MKGFAATRYPNLVRHTATGNYYARVRTGKGREVARSLETDSEAVAKLKLPRTLAGIRAAAGRLRGGNLTLGECAAVYLERRKSQGRRGKLLKARSLDYRTETVAMIRRMWPAFDETRVALVSSAECRALAGRARGRYSAPRYNGMLESLRGLLDVAVEAGAIERNPARDVSESGHIHRATVRPREWFLPDREQFSELLLRLDGVRSRRHAALAVRGLAFTGLRPNEAKYVEAGDVDLPNRRLLARETKNGEPRVIELIDQAVELFAADKVKVLAAFKRSPRKALATIARELGWDVWCAERKLHPLSPYTFRHLYFTRMIECGVDIIGAAADAGHRDSGRTLLRHYISKRPAHVREQMRKVVV